MKENEGERDLPTLTEPVLISQMTLTFIRDLPGFTGARNFVLEPLGDDSVTVFGHLRCQDKVLENGITPVSDLSLLVMSPWILWKDYEVMINEAAKDDLSIEDASDVMLLVVVHPKEPLTASTANLYSPIVINRAMGLADQLVPARSEQEVGWSIRTPFPNDGEI